MELDALIAIGGDGSLEIIADLAQQGGWNFVAVPKTIDNDIPVTDLEVRVSILGRIQRSSPPTTLDRLLAVSFGVKAVEAIAQSQSPYQQMVIGWNSSRDGNPAIEGVVL
jgi:6-phosphofructokinase